MLTNEKADKIIASNPIIEKLMKPTLTERQVLLAKVSADILNMLRQYNIEDMLSYEDQRLLKKMLSYDNVDQDIACLCDDMAIEFNFTLDQ